MGIGNIANTGMQAAMSNMEVISNNIANANTLGFKKSYINFEDIYPSSNGSAANQIGLGVNIAGVKQDFSPGSLQITGQNTDLSIDGNGFFVMRDSIAGTTSYTRAGRFAMDGDGYIYATGAANRRLQGYTAVNNSIPAGGTVADIQINNSTIPAKATTQALTQISLNSSGEVPSATFDPDDQDSFNYQTTVPIYDSLGNQHAVTSYYVKTAPNAWDVRIYVDNVANSTATLTFSTDGTLASSTGLTGISFSPTTGAAAPQVFDISMAGTTQTGIPNKVMKTGQDGYEAGAYAGFTIDSNGMVKINYTNNQTQLAGQVALAQFQSPEGLTQTSNMSWVESPQSGTANINQSNSEGNITSGQYELSNVELTTEMVNLLGAQHSFQANAQVEQTYNEVMQIVIKL